MAWAGEDHKQAELCNDAVEMPAGVVGDVVSSLEWASASASTRLWLKARQGAWKHGQRRRRRVSSAAHRAVVVIMAAMASRW